MKSATESELAKILRTMGNKDAIKILRFAKSGFDSISDMHKRLGLSVKRYYYRLERLMDAGLVLKKNDRYELTPLGVIVCDSMESRVLWALDNLDELQVIETLKTSKTIDDKTVERVATAIMGNKLKNPPRSVEVIQTYETLVDVTVRLFEKSTRKVYLATRYTDSRVVEATWRSMKRGVDIWGVDGDIGLLSGRLKMLRMVVSHPTSIKAFYELWHSDTCHIRYGKVPFSFIVVDDTASCVEILNPTMSDFFAAIQFANSETICQRLVKTFQKLWDEGSEDPLKDLSEELMSGLRE